jgi:hypothetical protein
LEHKGPHLLERISKVFRFNLHHYGRATGISGPSLLLCFDSKSLYRGLRTDQQQPFKERKGSFQGPNSTPSHSVCLDRFLVYLPNDFEHRDK